MTSRPKRGGVRSLDLSEETILLLKEHKRQQAEVKLKNRLRYVDLGLVFAQGWEPQCNKHNVLGHPLGKTGLGLQLERLCKAAGVKHNDAWAPTHERVTPAVGSGAAPRRAEEIGSQKHLETLGIYAHVLPPMQADAAPKLGSLLHG